MRNKKLVALMMVTVMTLSICGCGKSNGGSDSSKGIKKVGGISLLNTKEDELAAFLEEKGIRQQVVFYENLDSMVMAVRSGKIAEADIFGYMAEYAASRSDDLVCEYPDETVEDSMKMAVRDDDTQLLSDINSALQSMKDDKTFDLLGKKYIDEVIDGKDPKASVISSIKGADTIKVAVTGACAPFDYVDAAGNPAGYNVAVLSELGKKLNKNIELVSVDSSARSAALSSGKVDVLFWILSVNGDDSSDLPDGIIASDAFCTSDAAVLKLK